MLLKETALVRLFGLRIPLILFLGPRVRELDDAGCAVEIPLGYRSRNHLGSMYFGALHVGADLAAGLGAVREIRRGRRRVNLLFADSRAEFLKRADGDVVFRAGQGPEIRRAVEQADATGERVTIPVEVVATVPDRYGDEAVARFTLGLSLKRRE
jgi:hypothetical protein